MCADFVELVKIIWIAIGYVAIQTLYSMLHVLYTLNHSYVLQVQYVYAKDGTIRDA